jgi:hypothetical protein
MTYETLSAMLAAAVDDERIPRNPAKGARLAKIETAPLVPLTVEEVRGVAQGAVEHIRAAGVVATGTGLRQGERFGRCNSIVDATLGGSAADFLRTGTG